MLRTTGGFARPYTPVQPVGAASGTAFVLVGALGFVPEVTGGTALLRGRPVATRGGSVTA
ncbi:hypothetical protein H7X46_01875 [Pseudonocardia sp. C8]|uniref:hypothetical protein n=1 Tax=Pseudonocardia sp. C8 TaxID=2762759 RepID=UPI001642B331|nr:hypothetical protein [Pseudonocardia sp. C8]MBC3189814.1 hypothetical protein [Pseudonocardia sp. C8]